MKKYMHLSIFMLFLCSLFLLSIVGCDNDKTNTILPEETPDSSTVPFLASDFSVEGMSPSTLR